MVSGYLELPFSDKVNRLIRIFFVAAVYYLAGNLNVFLVYTDVYNEFPTYWPPPGFALGLIVLMGPSIWLGIVIASLFLSVNEPWFDNGHAVNNITISIFYSIGRVLEALAGYHLLKSWSSKNFLGTVKEVFIFIMVALLISPIGSGLSSFSIDYFFFNFNLQTFLFHWFSWYADNVIGILLFTPLVFAFNDLRKRKISKKDARLFILFLIIWAFIFFFFRNLSSVPLLLVNAQPFLVLPLLFWVALQFHAISSAISVILASLVAAYYTMEGVGPFAEMGDQHDTRLLLQSFLGVSSISTLFLNASVRERKRSEQNLARSEARQMYLLSSNPAIIYTLQAQENFRTTFISSNVFNQLGYLPDDFTSDPNFFFRNIHPDDTLQVFEKISSIFKNKSVSIRYRFKHKNRTWLWIQDELILAMDSHGLPLEIIGARVDISKQREAEEARDNARKTVDELNQSLQQFRFALHTTSIVSIADSEGIIKFANEPFIKLSQYNSEELIGQNHNLLKSGYHTKEFWAEMWSLVSNGIIWRGDIKNKAKDGSFYWLDTFIIPLKDITGNIIEYMSIRHDITEKKKHEDELAKLSLVASETSNYVVITDVEGKVEWVNSSFEKATGYILNEIKGLKPGAFLQGKETSGNTIAYMGAMLKEQKSFSCEILNYNKYREAYWVQVNCQPIKDKNGVVNGFFSIMQNITNQKKLMESLEESRKKAQDSERLKSIFLSNISHEIRTPMNAIMGFSELLERQLSEEKRKEFTRLLRRRSHDLLSILNDVLDFSRIEAGQVSTHVVEGNVGLTLNQIFVSQQAEISYLLNKPVTIKFFNDLYGGANDVLADFTHLKQVLNNLLSNAAKFTSTGIIEFGCTLQDSSTLLFNVRDSGIGISKERQEEVFKPFRQADENIHKKYGGSGLGLSICKGLVELWGGKIWVESEMKKGSVFYFTMPYRPLVDKSGSTNNNEKGIVSLWLGKTILIVEDDLSSGQYVQEALGESKATIILKISGKEAIEVIAGGAKIDLVLLDVGLPDISGLEVAEHIKKTEPDLPIIIISAFAQSEIKAKCEQLGCAAVLSKPISQTNLLLEISRVFKS